MLWQRSVASADFPAFAQSPVLGCRRRAFCPVVPTGDHRPVRRQAKVTSRTGVDTRAFRFSWGGSRGTCSIAISPLARTAETGANPGRGARTPAVRLDTGGPYTGGASSGLENISAVQRGCCPSNDNTASALDVGHRSLVVGGGRGFLGPRPSPGSWLSRRPEAERGEQEKVEQ